MVRAVVCNTNRYDQSSSSVVADLPPLSPSRFVHTKNNYTKLIGATIGNSL